MLKNRIKKIFRRIFERIESDVNIRRIKSWNLYREVVLRQENEIRRMQSEYPHLIADSSKKSAFRVHERRYYSQNGEDGILLYLFSKVGTRNKNFIEFGIEDGVECNAANLAINFGWSGLFIEGSPHLAQKARNFYHNRHKIPPERVKIVSEFLTIENVNQVFEQNLMTGEIDLLSIDIDGNDYWLWQSITCVNPRIVVIEYNASFGVERSITVEYDPAFDARRKHPSGWYHGASLRALVKLGKKKNYILVGCDSSGTNAFFVRADIAHGKIEEMFPDEAFYPSVPRLRVASQEEQFRTIQHLNFVEV